MIGAGIGVGVAIGVALWLITDSAVWIGAGIAIGVAIGAGFDQRSSKDGED
ncbi:NAD(P)(+) transhydrogenase (Re/Si-specific) subunit beta [Aeromicrobium piscarium]|uniref:NAD(P)(+) transhydrogenase (Re/Si-specific) subunit beta n=1 Tax=Aeromicrobium piscarium TaxID=2590901 RepID=A0A554S8R2_9ACTN|nr:NAD(P)(+) transhydrogenase (Re/Si-specific) subunit beta [Aeromicrobium piscarium]TSD62712.1 NAD(P)(+) transhydrogenase (Re/Si-specific) subunit beta [Aeromicrobium piscarium]